MRTVASSSQGKIPTGCLAAALILLPWGYRLPWDTTRALPLVLLAPALWFGRQLVTRRLELVLAGRSSALWLTALFGVAVTFAIIGSIHWASSITMAATWLLLALTAVLVSELIVQSPRASEMLLGSMVVSVAVATAVHWFRWKAGESSHSAFYPHPRLMGLHTLSGALAAIAMVLAQKERRSRTLWLVLGVLAWGGLLWSGSRSPLVGVAGGWAIWMMRLRGRERLRLLTATGALCAGGMLVSALFWTDAIGLGWWHVAQRSAVSQSMEQLTSNRSTFWTGALDHALRSLWNGYGPDAYSFLTPRLEGAQPHNLILQLVLDIGVLGTLAAMGLIGLCWWRGWKFPSSHPSSSAWLGLASGSLLASQFDGYFFYPMASIAAFLALGGCTADSRHGSQLPHAAQPRILARGWGVMAIVASALLLLNCGQFHFAANSKPPARPDSLFVRTWHLFPSVTYNVDLWIDAWSRSFPDDALAASLLARRHARSPEIFRIKSANLLARRGAIGEALAELEFALKEVRPEERPIIEQFVRQIQTAAASRASAP